MFRKAFITTVNFLFLLFLAGNSIVSAQNAIAPTVAQTKGIIIDKDGFQTGKNQFRADVPVIFGALKIGDTSAAFGSQLQDIKQSDWLKNTSFKVKNLTEKKITYVGIYLLFPDTETTGALMSHLLSYGRFPVFSRDGRSGILGERNKLLELAPLNDLDVVVKNDYETIARFIETRQPISTIKSVTITIVRIGFEDGTYWSPCSDLRCYVKYDTENPGQIIRQETPKLTTFTSNSF